MAVKMCDLDGRRGPPSRQAPRKVQNCPPREGGRGLTNPGGQPEPWGSLINAKIDVGRNKELRLLTPASRRWVRRLNNRLIPFAHYQSLCNFVVYAPRRNRSRAGTPECLVDGQACTPFFPARLYICTLRMSSRYISTQLPLYVMPG